MELKLSSEDRELLARVLERAIRELRPEVRRTGNPALHDQLKDEEARGVLARQGVAAGAELDLAIAIARGSR